MSGPEDSSDERRRPDPRASLRRDLDRYARRDSSERSFWQSLAVLGAVGWPIVIATVGGALAGRWLHARWDTGIGLTALLVAVGAGIGMSIAWQLIHAGRR